MIDTHNGKIRIRRWPRSRGKTRSPAQKASEEQFRAWQWATKYISPTMYSDIVEARKGTPILPRDFLTAMFAGSLIAIVTTDGKVLWPMAARNKISETLDALGQTEGFILRRGPDYWEAVPQGSGGGSSIISARVQGLSSQAISANSAAKMLFDTVIADPALAWDAANNAFTVPLGVNRAEFIASTGVANGVNADWLEMWISPLSANLTADRHFVSSVGSEHWGGLQVASGPVPVTPGQQWMAVLRGERAATFAGNVGAHRYFAAKFWHED